MGSQESELLDYSWEYRLVILWVKQDCMGYSDNTTTINSIISMRK